MYKTSYDIPAMDCPAEENLIRMKLEGVTGLEHLDFDLASRRLTVYHQGKPDHISELLDHLNLGSRLIATGPISEVPGGRDDNQKRLLWTVLAINLVFFLLEISTGLISESMGLVADSLDMLADAFVYGLSLFAIGGSVVRKKQVARMAGYFQFTLAFLGFIEVLRRFFGMTEL
ncbi:MAG: cation transporter, partial [Saprospiraceae bacterium]|nr:cation transporter [Saprospiraceae bacterium]